MSNLRLFEELDGVSEAFAQLPLTDVGRDEERRVRTERIVEHIVGMMPSVPRDEAVAIATVLRHLLSHRSWFWLTREYGLTVDQVSDVVTWAATTLVDAAQGGDLPTRSGGIMNPELFPLDHPRAIDTSVVGSKAAGLARLRAAGFDVPDGVVLPVGRRRGLAVGTAAGRVAPGGAGRVRHAGRTGRGPLLVHLGGRRDQLARRCDGDRAGRRGNGCGARRHPALPRRQRRGAAVA